MHRASPVLAALAASAVLAGAAAVATAAAQPTLVVEAESGTELFAVPVEADSTVVLEYTHSVENSTVRDVYRVRDGGLELTAMEFSSFGAGLPARADVERTGRGTYLHRPADTEVHDPLVATGRVAGHDLVVDGRRYDLAERAGGGTVRLRVTDRLRMPDWLSGPDQLAIQPRPGVDAPHPAVPPRSRP